MNELTEQVSNATFMTRLYQSDLCDVKIKYGDRFVGDTRFTPSLKDKDWYVDNGNVNLIMTNEDLQTATITKVSTVEYQIETDELIMNVWLYKVMVN